MFRDINSRLGGKHPEGFRKFHVFVLHYETYRITSRMTSETMEYLFVGTDDKGGGLLVMERTARLKTSSGFFKLYVSSDDLCDICPIEYLIYFFLRYSSHKCDLFSPESPETRTFYKIKFSFLFYFVKKKIHTHIVT